MSVASVTVVKFQDKLRALGVGLADIRPQERIHRDVLIEAPAQISKAVKWHTAIRVGAFSMIHGPGEMTYSSVGRYCSIAPHAVLGSNEHSLDWLSTTSLLENPDLFNWSDIGAFKSPERYRRFPFQQSLKPITIGHDVWIGHGAFIRGGVTIGDGAVIAAKAVVTKDVPPYAIMAGVPAKQVRLRFSERLIEQLLDVQWWNYSIYDLLSAKVDLSDPQAAVDQIRALRDAGKLQPFEPEILTAMDFEARNAPPV